MSDPILVKKMLRDCYSQLGKANEAIHQHLTNPPRLIEPKMLQAKVAVMHLDEQLAMRQAVMALLRSHGEIVEMLEDLQRKVDGIPSRGSL